MPALVILASMARVDIKNTPGCPPSPVFNRTGFNSTGFNSTGLNSTGFKSTRLNHGFTLIELMVVILIAGMLVTFASLSVSNSADKQLETEAKRFVSLVKYAADEAIMNSREIILKIEEQRYSFAEPGLNNTLIDLGEDDPVFRARELPDHMHISGEIAGEKLIFEEKRDKDAPPDFAKIGIFSSGEILPFLIVFSQDDGTQFEVSGDFAGKLEYLGRASSN